MVDIELQRSSSGIGDAFANLDLGTLVPLAGLTTIGFIVAASVGGLMAVAVPNGLDPSGRLDAAAFGVGAILAAAGGMAVLPGWLSAPLALGSLFVLGMAAFGVLLGLDTDTVDDGRFRRFLDTADVTGSSSLSASSGSGCTSCGPSPSNQPIAMPAESGEIRTIGQDPVADYYR